MNDLGDSTLTNHLESRRPVLERATLSQPEKVMNRERVLKVVLVVVGLFFVAAAIPAIGGIRDPAHSDTGDTMMMGLYATLGVFLLLAVRSPARFRSVIALAAWSSPAHAAVTTTLGS